MWVDLHWHQLGIALVAWLCSSLLLAVVVGRMFRSMAEESHEEFENPWSAQTNQDAQMNIYKKRTSFLKKRSKKLLLLYPPGAPNARLKN